MSSMCIASTISTLQKGFVLSAGAFVSDCVHSSNREIYMYACKSYEL